MRNNMITGTIERLEKLIPWEQLCELINVDYYNKYLVNKDEIFVIDLDDIESEDCYDDDSDDTEYDGQPDEYTEWQDYMGGDDWDHGQYEYDNESMGDW